MVAGPGLADFGAFYERTYPRAFGIAFAMAGDRGLAEEITQDAYVAAFRERSRFRGDGPVEAWLYRIVVNTASSALRRRRVRFIVPLDALDPPDRVARDAGEPRDRSGEAIDHLDLCEALQHLDVRSRSAVVLRHYLDLDYATIAGILGTSSTNVGAILSRAVDRLRLTLDGNRPARPVSAAAPRKVASRG